MRFLIILLVSIAFLTLNSCKKLKQCSTPEQIELNSNGPVISGWPLHLSTINSQSYSYRWSGPKGWLVEYDYLTNMSGSESRDSIGPDDAGTYVVELISEGCVVQRGVVKVDVIAPPTPPCSVAINSSTTSMGGVGGVSYPSVSGSESGSFYIASGSNGNQAINFIFKTGKKPKAGVYRSYSGYYPDQKDQVSVYIQSGFYDFYLKTGSDVYVNEVNGKMQYSFCSSPFSNPVTTTPITVSCKLSIP